MFPSRQLHIGLVGPIDLRRIESLNFDDDWLAAESFPLLGDIANRLVTLGCRLTCFSLCRKTEKLVSLTNREKSVSAFIIPQRTKRAAFDFYREERRRLNVFLKASSCEILNAHWTYEYAAAVLDSGRRHLITAHDNPSAASRWFRFTRAYPHWVARSILGRRVLRQAKSCSAVSEYLLARLKPFLHSKVHVFLTPNGVPEKLIELGIQRYKENNLLAKDLNVVTVMNGFYNMKNGVSALRGFREFLKNNPTYHLHMFGASYEPMGEAELWARRHGFSENVVFHGKQKQEVIHSFLLSQGWSMLHSSLEESFGMAPLEAMALGIPVVGGLASGNIPYLLAGGKAGVLTDVRDPFAIAKSLESLKIKDYYAKVQREALGWAKQYSLGRTAANYLEVFGNLVDSPC